MTLREDLTGITQVHRSAIWIIIIMTGLKKTAHLKAISDVLRIRIKEVSFTDKVRALRKWGTADFIGSKSNAAE